MNVRTISAKRIRLVLLCAGILSAPPDDAALGTGEQTPAPEEPAQRVRLVPQFTPGQTLRYQMDVRTTSEGRSSGLVQDPQGPSTLEMSTSILLRLEILPGTATPGEASRATQMRLRVTYEKVAANTRSDIYDPAAEELAEQYRRLEGRSVELTLDGQGKVVDLIGFDEILKDKRAVAAARTALAQLAGGAGWPGEGIVPGQKWSLEHPMDAAPLVGVVLRTEAAYLRNEPCRLPLAAETGRPSPRAAAESCAVILTRFEIARRDVPGDATPEEYHKRGLRTSGEYGGSGESLAYVSLASGWVVSVTQTGTEEMDLTVTARDNESQVHYAGRVTTQTSLVLLPGASPKPGK